MASLNRPTISVVMAAYNGEKYIKDQMDSILSQLGPDDELIISLDPSSDQTERIIKAYSNKQIKLVNGPGKGLIKNFEHGLQYVKNDVLFLSDQDDLWMPNKVEKVLESLQDHLLIVHDCSIIDQDGKVLASSFMEMHHSKEGMIHNMIQNSFIGCCMAFKRELLPFVLPFPEKIPMHDQWIGLMALKKGKVKFVHDPLIKYRRHDGNKTNLKHASLRQMVEWRWDLIQALIKRR